MSIRPWRDIQRKKTRKIKVGSIEVGKSADLAILDKNPIEDIKNLNSVTEVFFMGQSIRRGSEDSNNSYIQKSPQI